GPALQQAGVDGQLLGHLPAVAAGLDVIAGEVDQPDVLGSGAGHALFPWAAAADQQGVVVDPGRYVAQHAVDQAPPPEDAAGGGDLVPQLVNRVGPLTGHRYRRPIG